MLETMAALPHHFWMEDEPHYHESVTDVELCQEDADEAHAEYRAEQAVERYFEERGSWEPDEVEPWMRSFVPFVR